MKKYEILYDWPVAQVQRLADSNDAENYAVGLGPAPLAAFTTLTEQIRGLGADLAAAKAARVHFTKWNQLRQCLEAFENQFGNFPGANLPKFRLFVLLADKLAQSAPPLDAADIDENAFEIRELPQPLPLCWFTRENAQSPQDSTAVFNCGDLAALEIEIAAANVSPAFAFQLLAALHALPALPAGHAVLVKRTAQPIEIAAIEAFVRLVVLINGKPVHATRRYANAPRVLDADAIRAGHVYQQWSEVLDVLSEYNSRDEVLLKYLTIYHVVENFMFKLPIVGLERQRNGKMFSIRDFQTLYDKTKMNEGDALKRLFAAVFPLQASAAATFQQHISTRWTALVPGVSQADIDIALSNLDLPFTFAGFQGQAAAGFFAKLVYAIRNAIVHNKETEFHLTYASLDPKMCALIESFLIPSLEEICFSLIGSPNTHLWYQNKQLQLYK
jgi:hypothetical protein